jgi:type IV pilus assembly protein PilQ
MKRALGLLALAALQLAAVPVRTHAPTGDVLGVSVVSAPGRAEVVVDIRGTVEVTDFVLQTPPRLVLDLTGARLVGPSLPYDGVNRAGIRNIRYSQFRSDVVRIVIELDDARDYQVTQESGAVRVGFEAAQTFAAWPGGGAAPAARDAELPSAIPPAAPARPGRADDVGATVTPAPQAVQQQRINVTFPGVSINDVIASFAAFSGRSIVTGSGVTDRVVTAEIHDQPWDVAFKAILVSQGLSAVELDGGIIRVDSRAALVVEDTTEPLATRSIRINYARASALMQSVQSVVTPLRGRVLSDTTTNSLIITDRASRIDTILEFVRRNLDRRTQQVAIQAKIIFVQRSDLERLGLRYDIGTGSNYFSSVISRDTTGAAPPPRIALGGNAVAAVANASETVPRAALELIYTTIIGRYAFSTFLQALQEATLADVQAEPQVTVVDNREATIFVGQQTPIRMQEQGAAAGGGIARVTVRLLETGIKLVVTPHVVMETREVLMELRAERSEVTSAPSGDIGGVFGTQLGITQILVRDGETAVIGGLTKTEVVVTRSGIPFLMDLPVIGRLFGFSKNEERREDLLILVTPHIVDDVSASETTQRR